MDALLHDLAIVCRELLPIAGAIALIFLCIALKKLAKLFEQLTQTVKTLEPPIQKLDTSMEKIQAPLDSVVKLSHGLDKAQDKTAEMFGKMKGFGEDSLNNLKDFAAKKEEEKQDTEE